MKKVKTNNSSLSFVWIFVMLSLSTLILNNSYAQEEEEQILYYQLEPLDDSLFIKIQEELFIDPPDPKAEIVADLRDPNNQTISIKGALYPLLALSPELRARIITFPFKLSLEESVHYSSVFTRVLNRMRFEKILNPPTVYQISPTLGYINPYLQIFGGERFGFPIKKDIGLSIGFGTPYSGALETNFVEANFHILGFRGGMYTNIDAFVEQKGNNNHNNLFVTEGIQFAYVIPFGNFLEVGYTSSTREFTATEERKYLLNTVNKDNIVLNPDGSIKYQPYMLQGSYVNFELRYAIKVLASTRSKFYVAQYLKEWHAGFTGRELSLAGSVFDLRLDAMFSSPVRQPEYIIDIVIQKIFESWAYSALAIGPSIILSNTKDGSFGATSLFVNFRVKVGSSL